MTDLETLLRRSGEDLHLDRPVAQVMSRGRVLRRRRRVSRATVALALVGVAAVGAPWVGSTRDDPPAPAGSPGPAMVRLSPSELRAADGQCRRDLIGKIPARQRSGELVLFAAGATAAGGDTVLYHDERYSTVCTAGSGWLTGGVNGVGDTPGAGRELTNASYARTAPDGSRTHALIAYGRIDASVTRVVGSVEGRQVEAAVGGGWYWLDVSTVGDPDSAPPLLDLRAYDSSGHLVSLVSLPA